MLVDVPNVNRLWSFLVSENPRKLLNKLLEFHCAVGRGNRSIPSDTRPLRLTFIFLLLMFVVQNPHDSMLGRVVTHLMVPTSNCLETLIDQMVQWLMVLACKRAWQTSSTVAGHPVFVKQNSEAKHFVGDLFVDVNVDLTNGSDDLRGVLLITVLSWLFVDETLALVLIVVG